MKRRTASLVSLVMLLVLLLQGCWNYEEVDTMGIVAGVAVDRGYEGYKYHLTIDIADTSSAGKDKPVTTKLIECEGDTLFDAVRNAARRTGFKFHWSNCQIAIISRDVADESILPVLDYLLRDSEPRLTMELFVSEESTAKEILLQKSSMMSIKSFEIDMIYEQNETRQPTASYQLLYQVYNTLASEGSSLVLPALRIAANTDSETYVLDGMAIFKKDRLKGFLTASDSKYAMFVMDRIKGGVLNTKASTGNTVAALEVFENKTSIIPILENGKIKFAVHTETDAALNELDEIVDVLDKKNRDSFEAAAEMQLQDSIANVVKLVQEQYGVDIFGFGEALHKSYPDTWYSLSQNWDDVFRNLQVEVTCKINIRDSGSKNSPVKVGG